MSALKGVVVGAGYFSQFHFEAWNRIANVSITGVCDVNVDAAQRAAKQYGIATVYDDFQRMLDTENPDFVDIVTRPDSHHSLVSIAAAKGIAVICQKALAPTLEESARIVSTASEANVPFMVHENFRFQPWYREIRRQIDSGAIGDRLHNVAFRCRTGDGWPEDAYLSRQPYFREMPRLMVFETGVHFVDTFRFLAGEIDGVYAKLNRYNSGIVGEDAAVIMFEFESGTDGLWDGNRFNEPNNPDARFTFGDALIEGNAGSIRLYGNGRLTLQKLGKPETDIEYRCERRGFAGDCVFATQKHFVEKLHDCQDFETSGTEYLKTLNTVEAIYESATKRQPVRGLVERSS